MSGVRGGRQGEIIRMSNILHHNKEIMGEGRLKREGRGQGGEWQREEWREKREWQESHSWPLRVEEKWINKYSSHSVFVYFTARALLSACVSLPLHVWQTSLSLPVCLWSRCCSVITAPPAPPALTLPPGLTKSTNSTRHRRKSLFPLQESALWNPFNKNTQCRLLGAHSMGSLNLFATADSSTLQYGVNIKMTNRGGGSLMVRELSCRPEGHMLLMAPVCGKIWPVEREWNSLLNSDAEAPGLPAAKQQRTNVAVSCSQVGMFGSKYVWREGLLKYVFSNF